MAVRVVEGKKPYTGGKAIEIDENKVISLRLRDENNLIIRDEGDNEIYVDLQLDDEIRPTDAFPVGVTTGRVIVDNGWDVTGTVLVFKTTSGDNVKLLYGDNGKLYIDNGTGTFKQIYLKGEVDALLQALRTYVDEQLALKQDKLIAGENITIDADGKTINAVLPPLSRFLSLWDCETGLPISFPTSDLPFEYVTGDHYLVSNIDSTTNYRPDGTEFDGTASSTVETADVQEGDLYIYDGNVWLLQINHDKSVAFQNIAGNPYDNTNLATALNAKQDKLTAGGGIGIGIEESDMKGPCPSGFHIPTVYELSNFRNLLSDNFVSPLSGWGNVRATIKFPYAGLRVSNTNIDRQGSTGYLWTSNCYIDNGEAAYMFICFSNDGYAGGNGRGYGQSIRPFANIPVVPDSSWTTLYDGSAMATGAGIFHNTTDGIISISSDGINWTTFADKNLGATQVWNSGDTLSEDNCGKYYQRGNNYGFPRTGTISNTSSTRVDASSYGPLNYYSSDTWITRAQRDSSDNKNLWGGVSQSTHAEGIGTTVINEGVRSLNSKKGDVTLTYTDLGLSSLSPVQNSNEVSLVTRGEKYVWNNKQNALPSQTVYTSKGTSKKVPQISTNSMGQVTGINEVDIAFSEVPHYSAGTGISFGQIIKDYSAMQGPCATGYHIPTSTDLNSVMAIWTGLGGGNSDGTNFGINLKLPMAGNRGNWATIEGQGSRGQYRACEEDTSNTEYGKALRLESGGIQISAFGKSLGGSIRPFKDMPVIPDGNWTMLYGTSIVAGGIFHDATNGLISMSSNGTDWITIADKNLGATAVWNSGDTLSETNCGTYFQWGNNYGFPRTGTISYVYQRVNTTGYGPGNYYNSSTWSTSYWNWSDPNNNNLWGGATGVSETTPIINTGVTSVNNNTGAVTINEVPSSGTTGYVLTKTANGYGWDAPSGGVTMSTVTVTLLANGWSSSTQTVNATGVTASNTVICSPDPSDISDYTSAGIYCSSQGIGTLTFECDTTPSNDIDVNVVILN